MNLLGRFGQAGFELLAGWVVHTQSLGHLNFHLAFNEDLPSIIPFVAALAKNTSLDSLVLHRGYARSSFDQKPWEPTDAALGNAVASIVSDNHSLRSLEIGFDAKEVCMRASCIAAVIN